MSRIITYPEADSLNQDDFLVIDGATDGTRKIKTNSLLGAFFNTSNNLFNKDDIDIVFNSEINASGTITETTNYFVSGFINNHILIVINNLIIVNKCFYLLDNNLFI